MPSLFNEIESYTTENQSLENEIVEGAKFPGLFDEIESYAVSEEPEKERSLLKTAGRGLTHGTIGLAESVGTGLQWAGNRIGSRAVADMGETASDYWGEKAEGFAPPENIAGKNVIDNPELLKNASWWVYNVSDMVPALAATIIPGMGAAKVAKAIQIGGKALSLSPQVISKLAKIGQYLPAGLVGGALEGSQTYKQVLAEGGSEEEAARAGELMTLGAGALNALGVSKILAKAGTGFKARIIKTLGAGVWEGLTEGAEEPTEVFAKYISKYLTDEELPDNLKEQLLESLKDAATVAPIAAVTGGGVSVISGGEATKPESKARDTLLNEDEQDVTAKELLTGEKEVVPEESETFAGAESLDAEEAAAAISDEQLEDNIAVVEPEGPTAPKWLDDLTDTEISKRIDNFESTQAARGLSEKQTQNLGMFQQELENRGLPAQEAKIETEGDREKAVKEPTPTSEKTEVALEEVGVEIPDFKTTGEAYAFGEKATPEQVKELQRLVKVQDTKFNELKKAGKLQEAMDEAIKHQLYNEALQKVEGTEQYKKFKPEKAVKPMHELTLDEAGEKVGKAGVETKSAEQWNKQLTQDETFYEDTMKDAKSMGVSFGLGRDAYITAKTDIDGLSTKYPFMSVRVKDVNGNRATIDIANFAKLSKEPAFTDRIRGALLYPKHSPEEKQSGFMDNIFEIGKSKLLPSKRKAKIEPIKPIDGIKFINNSTVTPAKQTEFIEALKDLRVRAHLTKYGVKEFIIEPPYKFELSGQANIDEKNHTIRVNADATNIINSVLHEIGHVDYDSLSKEQQSVWGTILAGLDNKAVNGYKKLDLPEEAYAETFAHQGEKWADEALAGAKPQTPKIEKPEPKLPRTEDLEGEGIGEGTSKRPKVEVGGKFYVPENKSSIEITKDYGKGTPKEDYPGMYRMDMSGWVEVTDLETGDKFPITRNDLVELGIEPTKAKKPETEKVEVTKEDIEAFIKPLHHKYYLEGQNKGIAVEKLNAYGALQINKLVGSKLRANVDMDAVKQYLKEHPTKVEVTKKAGVEIAPEKKEPWEMSKEEWIENEIHNVSPQDIRGGETRRQIAEGALGIRKNQIKMAIEEGKTIPPEILKDYPDLKVEEKVEVETTPEGKEISVDLTKKEEAAVTPKQQKEYLLAEIDKAIESGLKESEFEGSLEEARGLRKSRYSLDPLAGVTTNYKFEVPNDGTFEIAGSALFEFQDRVKSAFPSTITSKKFKPKVEARKGVPTAKYNKILGKAAKDLKPADIDRIFKEVADTEARDTTGVVLLNPFQNWLLSQDITKAVKDKIRSVAGKDYIEEARVKIETQDIEYARSMVEHTRNEYDYLRSYHSEYKTGEKTLKQIAEETGVKRSGNELAEEASEAKSAYYKAVAHLEKLEKPTGVKEPTGVRDEKAFATKEEIDTDAIKERGIKGDALLDVIDIIDEAKSHDKTIEIDKEGYVILYHRTTKANADNIKKTGYMTTKEPGLFFGSKPTGQIDGYGDTVVKVRIPIEKLELNDIFTNEVHFRLSKAMPGKKYKIEVLDEKAFATKAQEEYIIKPPDLSPDEISEVARNLDYRDKENAIRYLESRGKKYIDGYHVAQVTERGNIKEDGIMTGSAWYGREEAVYFFADPNDIRQAIPYLAMKTEGDKGGDVLVAHFRIPIEDIKNMEYDGFFASQYYAYSSFYIKKDIPTKQIVDYKLFKLPSAEDYKNGKYSTKTTTKATKPQETITRKDLRKIFKRMKHIRTGQDSDGNLWFKAEGRPKITIFELDNITGHLNTSAGQIPVGSYLRDTIELKTGGEGHTADIGTAYHEFFHWLSKNGIISANDITALNRVIAKAIGISESNVTEEHRAYYVGDNISAWETQKHPRIRRILRKLTDFMNAIYDFAAQAGWVKGRERTAEGVIRDIESGRILKEKKEALAGVNEFAQAVSFSLKKAVKAVTDNPNFVKWFGDSVVKDENSNPLVLYHGTAKADFSEFKLRKLADYMGQTEAGQEAFFFSSDAKTAEAFTRQKVPMTGAMQAIYPVYLSLQNPLIIDRAKFTLLDDINNGHNIRTKAIQRAKKRGNDGVIFKNMWDLSGNKTTSYAVFKPTQIKSIFNTGAFGIKEKDIRYQMAGVSAIGAPTGALVKAQEMLAEGKDKKEVWRETGWLFSKEGKWKFEVDDSGAKLKDLGLGKQIHKLGDVLDHPKLYEAYPKLKEIRVHSNMDTKDNWTSGSYFHGEGLEGEILSRNRIMLDGNPNKAMEYIHHEVAHAVQNIEGFAKGGSPKAMKTMENVAILAKGALAIKKKAISDSISEQKAMSLLKSEGASFTNDMLFSAQGNNIASIRKIAKGWTGLTPQEAYEHLLGEIEARDTEARAKLTPEQRREQMPYESQGIPEDQWIITDGKGTSFSVSEQKAFSVKGDDQAGPSFQETLEPVTQEDYIANRKTNKNIKLTIITNTKRVASEIVEGVDKFLGAISTRLGNVSPGLRAKLRKLDFDINTKYAKDVKKVEPLLRKAKKMALDDIIDWDYARKNSDIARIHELVSKYNMQEEYAAYREALGKVREEGLDVGLKIGEIKEYAPRILKDQRGFLKAIGKSEYRPLYSDKLKERADDLGITVESMHPDMKADIVSNIILGGWTGLGGVPATKHRVLKKIPADLNKYYMDSDAALMQHLYSMRKLIEAQKFFGKIPKKVDEMRKRLYAVQTLIRTSNSNMGGKLSAGQMREMVRLKKSIKAGRLDNKQTATARRIIKALENISTDTMPDEQIATIKKHRNKNIGLEKEYTAYIAKYALQRDYTENIGAYIIELIENKEISPKHEQVVNEILSARFHEHGTHGVIQAYKNMSYIDTMGSPISALTQIGDFAWPLFEYGIPATLKHAYRSIARKSKITRADVGVDRIAQEFADSGALGDAVSIVFKMVGLEQIDAIGKETLLNAALEDYQNQAKNNPTKLKREIRSMFEAETDSVIDDLVNDEISDNVKLLTYSKLLDFQPVGLSEMTQQYLTAGNGRLFYMLKTFTLKQFDIFRRISYNKIVRGNKAEKLQGVKNLIKLSMLFVLANAGADELKDWVLGRKTDFSDRMVDNILRLFGVSKFVTWKARTEGVGSALARQILPPFKFIDSAGKDIITAGDEKGLEVIGSIPVIGKLAYWHMGRGRSKREDLWNRRLRKRKSKLNKIKDRFDIAKDKRAFEGKHRNELSELRRINRLQGRLNKKRERINKLKRLQETVVRKKEIQRLEVERTNMIKKFLTAER